MFPYWFLLAVFAAGAVLYNPPRDSPAGVMTVARQVRHPLLFTAAALLLVALVGLRNEVGGDWTSYFRIFQKIKYLTLTDALQKVSQEPAYVLVNWLSAQIGGGIWLVNLLCAVPFTAGLIAVSKQQPNPWLALVVATPFFIIGVGMGYTRQSVAIGCLLLGLTSLFRGTSFWKFAAWVILGSLFHRSVIVMIPLAAMFFTRNRIATLALAASAVVVVYYTGASSVVVEQYKTNYIQARYAAQGAGIRLWMNIGPAIITLLYNNRFRATSLEKSIWRGWSIMAFVALGAYFIVPSSVAVDRLSLYLIPIQMYALSRLPFAFRQHGSGSVGLTIMIILYSALVQFVWLNYANNAPAWIPYRAFSPV